MATSRLSSLAEEPERKISTRSVSNTRRTNFSQPGHHLDFIQEEHSLAPVPPFGIESVILLHDPLQVAGSHLRQPLVLKAEVQQALAGHAGRQPVGQHLPQEGGLPARRGPITATALPGTRGSRTVRRVKSGTGTAKASTIFCRIKSLIYPSNKDIIS